MAESSVPTQVGPATEAGRLLLAKNTSRDTATNEWLLNDILVIEQQAAAIERRRTVERLRTAWFDHDAVQDGGAYECGCEGAGNHIDIDRTFHSILEEGSS